MSKYHISFTEDWYIIPRELLNKDHKSNIPGLQWDQMRLCWKARRSPIIKRLLSELMDVELLPKFITADADKMKTKPFKHQMDALSACGGQTAFAFLMEQGTGKTKVCIDDARFLMKENKLERILVICPKSVISSWVKELQTHANIAKMDVVKWSDGKLVQVSNVSYPILSWMIINHDAMITINGYTTASSFISINPEKTMMIVDESTSIKNQEAKRTKKIIHLSSIVRFKRIVTGTPIANNPTDIYSQFKFLDPGIFFNWDFFPFRSRYCILGEYNQVVGTKNEKELAFLMSSVSFRVTKDECMDLPAKVYETREIAMSSEAKKIYLSILTEIKTYIISHKDGNKTITANAVITKTTKLQQITGGAVKSDDGTPTIIDSNKMQEALNVIEESQHPVIVWCQFRHEITRLLEFLSNRLPDYEIYSLQGSMNESTRGAMIEGFEKGGTNKKIIVVQNDTGSEGITLNAAGCVIFYSNSNKFRIRLQAEDRCHRAGQTKSVTYVDLVCPGTIDVSIIANLKKKKDWAESVYENLINIDKLLLPKEE